MPGKVNRESITRKSQKYGKQAWTNTNGYVHIQYNTPIPKFPGNLKANSRRDRGTHTDLQISRIYPQFALLLRSGNEHNRVQYRMSVTHIANILIAAPCMLTPALRTPTAPSPLYIMISYTQIVLLGTAASVLWRVGRAV
jgi:hypothetical protein